MNFEKGRIFSSLCCGALQHHGAIEVARRMHLIALNYNDNKIVQLNCDYRGFFDRVFKRKLISRVYAPITQGFIHSYIERRFISFISRFEDTNGDCLPEEWINEFHYHYWAFFAKTLSKLISSEGFQTSQEEVANTLVLFKHMPMLIKEQQFAAFLKLLSTYPNRILSTEQIENLSYKTESDWSVGSLPYDTRPILAKSAYEELFTITTNICTNMVADILANRNKDKKIFDEMAQNAGLNDGSLLDRNFVFSVIPITTINNSLVLNKLANILFSSDAGEH